MLIFFDLPFSMRVAELRGRKLPCGLFSVPDLSAGEAPALVPCARGAGGCLPESGVLPTSPWVIGTPLSAPLPELVVNVTPHGGSTAAEEAGDSPGSPPCVGAL